MYSSKSDTLDELRLKIGEYGDKMSEPVALVNHIIRLLVKSNYIFKSAYVYSCEQDGFYLYTKSGEEGCTHRVPFSNNPLSICAVRGTIQIIEEQNGTSVLIPGYEGHHLLGILVIYTETFDEIDQDDIDFLNEVVKYVVHRLSELES